MCCCIDVCMCRACVCAQCICSANVRGMRNVSTCLYNKGAQSVWWREQIKYCCRYINWAVPSAILLKYLQLHCLTLPSGGKQFKLLSCFAVTSGCRAPISQAGSNLLLFKSGFLFRERLTTAP
ncbi:hypothetical protein ANAPC5_01301 [Anaplasma phagocytophilum]|nr:hypothetical protein ANAPC5_01301 [Anaplasma phagocytophilum]